MAKDPEPKEPVDPDADLFEGLEEEDVQAVKLAAKARVLAARMRDRETAPKPKDPKKKRSFLG